MKPTDYFPAQYLADLVVFTDRRVPQHGPFSSLCGWALSGLFAPANIKKYVDPAAFLCVLYNLNLLNQGIHTYFQQVHHCWLKVCAPFPDSRGCTYHGGVTSAPSSVLEFALDPSYIAGAQPIEVPKNVLAKFTKFFLSIYLTQLCETERFLALSPRRLIDRLSTDADCPEFRQCIGADHE